MTNTIEDDIEFECIGNVLLEEAVSAIDSKIENHCTLVFLWYFNIRYILCGNTHDQFNYNEVSLIYIPRTKKITRHIPSTKEFPIFLKYMNSQKQVLQAFNVPQHPDTENPQNIFFKQNSNKCHRNSRLS